jgi:hypothetical protein
VDASPGQKRRWWVTAYWLLRELAAPDLLFINAVRYTYGVKFNSPRGRVLYFASALFAIGMTVFVWTYFADEPIAFKLFFSVFVLGILIYNGRLAFRGKVR